MNKNRPHYLRHNVTSALPQRLFFLDTETTRDDSVMFGYNTFRLGVSCYIRPDWKAGGDFREIWRPYYDRRELLDEIDRLTYENSPLYVYGSNLSFDLASTGIVSHFTKLGYELKMYHEKGLVFILIVKNEKRTIKFLSMQNFIPTSIKKIGKSLGIETVEVDFATCTQDELVKHCYVDVQILKEAVLNWYRFVNSNDLGGGALTVSGQAFKAFRHRFMKHKILILGDPILNEYERRSYHGGRVECFRIGKQKKQKYVQIDINSAYPYVMSKYDYPTKKKGYLEYNKIDVLKKRLDKYAVIALVFLETDEPAYIRRVEDKTCFPIGRFWTHLTSRELIYALERGHVKKLFSGVYYERKPLFIDYIDYFYKKRLETVESGNKVYNNIIKLFMNGLYGKFGQKFDIMILDEYTKNDDFYIEDYYIAETGEYGTERTLFHRRQILSGQQDANTAFPAISSHITADVRLELYKIMCRAGIENVYYVDTDSIITDEETYHEKLSDLYGTGLGKVKIECSSDHLTIHNLKDYEIGDKKILKGVQWRSNKDGEETFHTLHNYGLRSLMRHRIETGAILKEIEIKLSREYTKGNVNTDGSIYPFSISESELLPPDDLKNLGLNSQYVSHPTRS